MGSSPSRSLNSSLVREETRVSRLEVLGDFICREFKFPGGDKSFGQIGIQVCPPLPKRECPCCGRVTFNGWMF